MQVKVSIMKDHRFELRRGMYMSMTIMNLSYLIICIHFQETHFSTKRLIFISCLIEKGANKAAVHVVIEDTLKLVNGW